MNEMDELRLVSAAISLDAHACRCPEDDGRAAQALSGIDCRSVGGYGCERSGRGWPLRDGGCLSHRRCPGRRVPAKVDAALAALKVAMIRDLADRQTYVLGE